MAEMDREQEEIIRSIEERISELKAVRQSLLQCKRDLECMETELVLVRKQNDRLLTSLKDCANELCQKCGQYRNDHLGACDGCKWKEVKHWDVN